MLKHIAKSFSTLLVVENCAIEHDIALCIYLLFNNQNMQNLRDCTVSNDVSLILCCYQASETKKYLMEINNLAFEWLYLFYSNHSAKPTNI